jgi:hypothetical protein
MNQSESNTLVVEVRHFLSRRLIQEVVKDNGLAEIFYQSQSWAGYERACDCWHEAYWEWVWQQIPAADIERLKSAHGDWLRLPVAEVINRLKANGFAVAALPSDQDGQKRWLEELARQEIAERHSIFNLAMRGPEAKEPGTYGLFLRDAMIASENGLTAYNEALAKQKQRKPTKNKGDRRLQPQLLVYWIPACLWAFTTEGIAQFLHTVYPRSENKVYDNKTISDAIRDLKLVRSPRPLWRGVTGVPPKLESL